MKRPAVDTGCYDLAEKFLGDLASHTEDDVWELAAILQNACEAKCQEVENRGKE